MRFMMLMIPKGYESAAPGTVPDAKAVEAMNQRAAIAVEIEHHRPAFRRRHVPGDQFFAVGGFKHDFFGFGEAGLGGRRARPVGKIHQHPLREISERHHRAIADQQEQKNGFQRRHRR